ncbi:MAG: succinylglutamate desuccinylase/aspartoacylase family protein [Gammaproteobacteria bacterium]|nr:succinylglutamate desuccinylase/aspartoacylase family protein [Gammaproteobacteria bacterium]
MMPANQTLMPREARTWFAPPLPWLALLVAASLAGCGPRPPGPGTTAHTPPAASLAESERPVARPPKPAEARPAPPVLESPPVPAITAAAPPPTATLAEDAPLDTASGALELLGERIAPATATRLMWSASSIFEGMSSETPVLVVNGAETGPVLCLTAAVHGDELNGIEMVRRVFQDLAPDELKGAVIGVPIVNIHGFRRGSRYLPDRRDLNRFFPGNPQGSSAARIAYSLFENIIRRCDAVVDLHTGSFFRNNLPQVRADLSRSEVADMAHGFGGMLVLNSEAPPGSMRRAATDAGIPAVIIEAGEPLRMQPRQVEQGVAGINRLMRSLGMIPRATLLKQPEPVYYSSRWVRADHGGVLFSVVRLGQTVRSGDILGTVTDPITNEQNLIYSPSGGRVIGMAVNQVVMPGFAAFHLGTESQPVPTPAAGRPGEDENGKDWEPEPGVLNDESESDEGGGVTTEE